MSRVCALTGKGVLCGHRVSHANNKTKRKFQPNLQMVSFLSDKLGAKVRVRLSANAIRTVEKRGGIDNYIMESPAALLTSKFKKMKKMLKRRGVS